LTTIKPSQGQDWWSEIRTMAIKNDAFEEICFSDFPILNLISTMKKHWKNEISQDEENRKL
jgi:hypothetical protein